MIVVADASPLIFLAKLNRLDWIGQETGMSIHLSSLVHAEVMGPNVAEVEGQRLKAFFSRCRIHSSRKTSSYATALSAADNASLALAIRLKAERLLSDDRILRAMSEAQGIRPMGTLGLLLGAHRQGRLSADETRRLLDALVSVHGFRISIQVYQASLAQIRSTS